MGRYFNNFLLMLQLLTRIPINKALPCENEDFKRGANFFWLIGLLIGMLQYLLSILLIRFIPVNFAAMAIIIFEILITGALHMDGFGDCCDGFFAFKGKDKIIEIMKDSQIGTFGCIGIVLNLLIKYQGYVLIFENNYYIFLLIIPMISRLSMIFLSYIGKPAKKQGSGNLFIDTVKLKEVLVNTIFVLITGFILGQIVMTIILFVATIIITLLFYSLCNSKINGITGDCLGANNESVVLVMLVLLSCIYI